MKTVQLFWRRWYYICICISYLGIYIPPCLGATESRNLCVLFQWFLWRPTYVVPSQIRTGELPMHDSPSRLWPAEVNDGNFACRHDYPMRFFNRQWLLKVLYDQLKYTKRIHMGSRVDRISSHRGRHPGHEQRRLILHGGHLDRPEKLHTRGGKRRSRAIIDAVMEWPRVPRYKMNTRSFLSRYCFLVNARSKNTA